MQPVYKCNHPATVCDTCGLCPKQHTKKRGALANTKKTKITRRRAWTWVEEGYEKDPKGSIHNERRNAVWSKTTLRRTQPYKMLKRTTKPLKRTILIEEGLAKGSKKQHSENTDK